MAYVSGTRNTFALHSNTFAEKSYTYFKKIGKAGIKLQHFLSRHVLDSFSHSHVRPMKILVLAKNIFGTEIWLKQISFSASFTDETPCQKRC